MPIRGVNTLTKILKRPHACSGKGPPLYCLPCRSAELLSFSPGHTRKERGWGRYSPWRWLSEAWLLCPTFYRRSPRWEKTGPFHLREWDKGESVRWTWIPISKPGLSTDLPADPMLGTKDEAKGKLGPFLPASIHLGVRLFKNAKRLSTDWLP